MSAECCGVLKDLKNIEILELSASTVAFVSCILKLGLSFSLQPTKATVFAESFGTSIFSSLSTFCSSLKTFVGQLSFLSSYLATFFSYVIFPGFPFTRKCFDLTEAFIS